jgi:hypothetical protein
LKGLAEAWRKIWPLETTLPFNEHSPIYFRLASTCLQRTNKENLLGYAKSRRPDFSILSTIFHDVAYYGVFKNTRFGYLIASEEVR